MQVKYYATLRDAAGVKSETFELPKDANLSGLKTVLASTHPGFEGVLFNPNGEFYAHIQCFINNQSLVVFEKNPVIPLKDGDIISFFPAVEGG